MHCRVTIRLGSIEKLAASPKRGVGEAYIWTRALHRAQALLRKLESKVPHYPKEKALGFIRLFQLRFRRVS